MSDTCTRGMNSSITTQEYRDHADAYDGFCLACGEFTCGGVEPDAEGYECPYCDAMKVVGTEQALLLGSVDITE